MTWGACEGFHPGRLGYLCYANYLPKWHFVEYINKVLLFWDFWHFYCFISMDTNPLIHNVEKWLNILYGFKYVCPFFIIMNESVNPFYTTGLFIYPLKTLEKHSFLMFSGGTEANEWSRLMATGKEVFSCRRNKWSIYQEFVVVGNLSLFHQIYFVCLSTFHRYFQ